MNIPQHIAIIMDGNGRWAKKKGFPRFMGHRAGMETIKKTVKSCIKLGIKYLTIYAFSTENWYRPKNEVTSLLRLLDRFLNTQINVFNKNNIKLCVIGERAKLDPGLCEKIEDFEKKTFNNDALTMNIALSYGGRQEIISAVRRIAEDVSRGAVSVPQIDEDLFSKYLYTKHCPDPDLLIRTSGEMRISNFLLWQISYSEIYVTPKLWPDFNESDLKKAIEEYQKRERRFGKR
jgi:undecaprenyl diphosphate synthase